MATILQIDGWRAGSGNVGDASIPPHATIHNADFVPALGDFITVEGHANQHQVIKRVFHYAINPDGKHRVDVTVTPATIHLP